MTTSVQLCLSEPRTPDGALVDDVRAASEAGFSALDLWLPKLDDCLAVYPLVWLDMHMQQHHVYARSVSGLEPLPLGAPEDVLVHKARFLDLCTHLDTLGGGTIIVNVGTPPLGSGIPAAIGQSQIARALGDYGDLAAPFEVQVAVEFQAHSSSAIRTLAASQEIVDRVARNNVGLALSIDQLHKSGGQPGDIEALDVKKLWLVRLETSLQNAVCKRLAATGFRGPYCVEWPALTSINQQNAGPDSLIERARRSRQAALDLLTPLYP